MWRFQDLMSLSHKLQFVKLWRSYICTHLYIYIHKYIWHFFWCNWSLYSKMSELIICTTICTKEGMTPYKTTTHWAIWQHILTLVTGSQLGREKWIVWQRECNWLSTYHVGVREKRSVVMDFIKPNATRRPQVRSCLNVPYHIFEYNKPGWRHRMTCLEALWLIHMYPSLIWLCNGWD